MKTVAVRQHSQPLRISNLIINYIAPVLLAVVDYAMIVLAFLSAWYVRAVLLPQYFPDLLPFHINDRLIYYIIPLIYFIFLLYSGLYTKRLPFWKSAETLFKVCLYVNVVAIVVMYFTGKAGDISRIFMVLSGVFCFGYLLSGRYIAKKLLIACSLWQKPVVIVGAGKTAEILAKSFVDEPGLGYKIVGLIEDCYDDKPLLYRYPHLGCFADAEKEIIKSGVQDVIIAAPGLEREKLLDIVYRIQPHVRNLTIVPDLFGMPLSNMEAETLYNEQTVMLKMHNNLSSWKNRCAKRFFDIIVGSAILLITLPILLILALTIKLDSKGSAFHIARRLGQYGKEFWCFKFRTMYLNADDMLDHYFMEHPEAKKEWKKYAKLKDYDPRVTKVGKWLRKYSLDELPQIINVLMGNMSLVGPRPYLPREKERMGYMAHTILETVPGITGLWQVSGRNEIDFEGRLRLDSWYVRNWSLWQDIVLLFKTVKVVLKREGAY